MFLCLLPQPFSQLGGLQLDREVRSLVAAAGDLTTRPVRDKFARLTQVCMSRVREMGEGGRVRIQMWCASSAPYTPLPTVDGLALLALCSHVHSL